MSGSTLPTTCAHSGIPRNGNMKPDSRIDGRKKKNVICIACSWLRAIDEKVMPSVRLAAMNSSTIHEQHDDVAVHRHVEQVARGEQDQRHLDQPDHDVGNDLPGHHLDRQRRRRQQVLEGAALALARHAPGRSSAPSSSSGSCRAGPARCCTRSRPRGCSGGARARRPAAADGAPRASAPARSRASAVSAMRCTARDRVGHRGRVGGVRLDQQLRRLAAHQLAREVGRHGDDELHVAAREQLVRLGLASPAG